jgi:plasmid stabilization system protein ParE
MSYSVIWTPEAEEQLAAVWMAAANPAAVTRAAERADLLLANDPLSSGTEFYGDRLLTSGPLHIVYKVSPPRRSVIITMVW